MPHTLAFAPGLLTVYGPNSEPKGYKVVSLWTSGQPQCLSILPGPSVKLGTAYAHVHRPLSPNIV